MSFGWLGGPPLDTEQIVALKNAADALKKLTKALASVGEDSLAIIPRLQLPLNVEDVDDYSEDLAEMQTQTDPFPGETPSAPTYLSGELERIRYQLAEIMGADFWYEDPVMSLASLKTLVEDHAGRHAEGGGDPLGALSIDPSMLQDEIPYSKLDLTESIVNADIAAAAAIAWSKIAVDPNVVYDDVAETITQTWKFTGMPAIKIGDDLPVDFYGYGAAHVGRIVGYVDEFRVRTMTAGMDLVLIAHEVISLTSKGHNTVTFDRYTSRFNSGVDATPSCDQSLGSTGNWLFVFCGTVYDNQCSCYPTPTNAFEVLSVLPNLLTQDAPDGKIDSKNYPLPLKPRDPETGAVRKGRSLSAIVDYLIFAMGDIREELDAFEQRLAALEAQP